MKKVFVVRAGVSGITGERQIATLKALGVDLKDLPQGLRTLWKQGVIPSEHLRPTGRIRKQVEEYLFKHSVKGGLGWVVPAENVKQVIAWLKTKQAEHQLYVDKLCMKWGDIRLEAQQDLRQKFGDHPLFPELLAAMQRAQPQEAEVRHKLTMSYSISEFYQGEKTGDEMLDEEIEKSSKADRKGLVHQLFRDTAKKADELFSLLTSGEKDRTINRRSLRKVEDYLVKKIKSLSFLDKRLIALAGGVEQVLSPLMAMPEGKTITAAECGDLIALMAVLSSEERLKNRLDALQPGEVLTVASMLPQWQLDGGDAPEEEVSAVEAGSATAEEVVAASAQEEAEGQGNAEEEVTAVEVAAESEAEPEAEVESVSASASLPQEEVPTSPQVAVKAARPVSVGAMSWGR